MQEASVVRTTVNAPLGGFEASAGAGLGLRSCSAAGAALDASAVDRPPGTNSAAVGLSDPLLRAVFREGACMSSDMLRLQDYQRTCDFPQ